MKDRIIFYIKALFFLPGTFLHELSHFIVAKILGAGVTGFSLLPIMHRDEQGRVVSLEYGRVDFYPRVRVFNFLIGMAPLLLWGLLYQLYGELGIIDGYSIVNFRILLDPHSWMLWYVSFVLLLSGKPSGVDFEMSLGGFFSPSGFVVASMCSVIIFFWADILFWVESYLPISLQEVLL